MCVFFFFGQAALANALRYCISGHRIERIRINVWGNVRRSNNKGVSVSIVAPPIHTYRNIEELFNNNNITNYRSLHAAATVKAKIANLTVNQRDSSIDRRIEAQFTFAIEISRKFKSKCWKVAFGKSVCVFCVFHSKLLSIFQNENCYQSCFGGRRTIGMGLAGNAVMNYLQHF